jgi:hypothetical protein
MLPLLDSHLQHQKVGFAQVVALRAPNPYKTGAGGNTNKGFHLELPNAAAMAASSMAPALLSPRCFLEGRLLPAWHNGEDALVQETGQWAIHRGSLPQVTSKRHCNNLLTAVVVPHRQWHQAVNYLLTAPALEPGPNPSPSPFPAGPPLPRSPPAVVLASPAGLGRGASSSLLADPARRLPPPPARQTKNKHGRSQATPHTAINPQQGAGTWMCRTTTC